LLLLAQCRAVKWRRYNRLTVPHARRSAGVAEYSDSAVAGRPWLLAGVEQDFFSVHLTVILLT
jgi:hypothetical protein